VIVAKDEAAALREVIFVGWRIFGGLDTPHMNLWEIARLTSLLMHITLNVQ
jgi:hypothetical protein